MAQSLTYIPFSDIIPVWSTCNWAVFAILFFNPAVPMS